MADRYHVAGGVERHRFRPGEDLLGRVALDLAEQRCRDPEFVEAQRVRDAHEPRRAAHRVAREQRGRERQAVAVSPLRRPAERSWILHGTAPTRYYVRVMRWSVHAGEEVVRQ